MSTETKSSSAAMRIGRYNIRVYASHTGMAFFGAVSEATERENVVHRTEWFAVPDQTAPTLLAGHKRAARAQALNEACRWADRNDLLFEAA